MNHIEELRAQLTKAVDSNDYTAMSRISNQIRKLETEAAANKLLAMQQELSRLIPDIQRAIIDTLEPFIDSGKLDKAEGVYFNWTFGDEPDTTLQRAHKRPAHRVIKHPGIKTIDLVRQYGNIPYPDKPECTYADMYYTNTDPNFRYPKIRVPLLEMAGIK